MQPGFAFNCNAKHLEIVEGVNRWCAFQIGLLFGLDTTHIEQTKELRSVTNVAGLRQTNYNIA